MTYVIFKILLLLDLWYMKNINTILEQQVANVMSKNIVTLHPKELIERAIDIFESYDIHHIPIVVLDNLVGIISQGDVLYFQGEEQKIDTIKSYNLGHSDITIHSTVEEIMTPKPFTVDSTQSINDAILMLLEHRVNALPVLQDGKLCGIITSFDILRFITNQ